jgi:lysophospholipase L1-like esterase
MNRRILCFGDSNTYGYDPRSYLGERYGPDIRWPGILAAEPDWEVLNCGENGREIPHIESALLEVDGLLDRCGRLDCFAVMLGTNDLLKEPGFTAEDAAARMEILLERVLRHPRIAENRTAVLLIAPPPMRPGTWVTELRMQEQSARLGVFYMELARRQGIAFVDAGMWDVPVVFDGVHFSPEGHRTVAAVVGERLEQLLEKE